MGRACGLGPSQVNRSATASWGARPCGPPTVSKLALGEGARATATATDSGRQRQTATAEPGAAVARPWLASWTAFGTG